MLELHFDEERWVITLRCDQNGLKNLINTLNGLASDNAFSGKHHHFFDGHDLSSGIIELIIERVDSPPDAEPNVIHYHNLPDTNVYEPTANLIRCAYPHGIPHAHYMTLLSILTEDTSIRVLASVIAAIRGGHYTVYMNDVVEAKKYERDDGVYHLVKEKLMACGYEEWLKESE